MMQGRPSEKRFIAWIAMAASFAAASMAWAGSASTGNCDPPNVEVRGKIRIPNNTGQDANDLHFYMYQNDRDSVHVTGAKASGPCTNVGLTLDTDNGQPGTPPPGNHGSHVDMDGCDVPARGQIEVEVSLCMNERNCIKFKDIQWTHDGAPLPPPPGPPPNGGWRVGRPRPGGGGGGRPGNGAQEGNGGAGHWIHRVCIENDDTRWLVLDELKLLASTTYYASLNDIDWTVIAPVQNAAGEPPVCIAPGGVWCFDFETTGSYLNGHVYLKYNLRVAGTDECGPGANAPSGSGGEENGTTDDPDIETIGDHPVDDLLSEIWEGLDLWQTVPTTSYEFGTDLPAIPADFFGPGSDPFEGQVAFTGLPLGPDGADTVVARLEEAQIGEPGTSDTVPIEIVALSLQSVEPIQVTFSQPPTPSLVDVQLPEETTFGQPPIPIGVSNDGGLSIDTELIQLGLTSPGDPMIEQSLLHASDDGGGPGLFGNIAQIELLPLGPLELPPATSLNVQVDIQDPGGLGHLPMPSPPTTFFIDSFFDVSFNVDLGGGLLEDHLLHMEVPPGQPLAISNVQIDGWAIDSFFDVSVELQSLGPIDPSLPLLLGHLETALAGTYQQPWYCYLELDPDALPLTGTAIILRTTPEGGEFTYDLQLTPLASFDPAGGTEALGGLVLPSGGPVTWSSSAPFPWTYAPATTSPALAGPGFYPATLGTKVVSVNPPGPSVHTLVQPVSPPRITGWYSVRDHGALGNLAIRLDESATGANVISEPRRNGPSSPGDGLAGIKRIEIDFDRDVSSCYVPGVTIMDANPPGTVYSATSEFLTNGGQTLVAEFVDGLGNSTLPDETCYVMDLSTVVTCLSGDPDCGVRALTGDVAGAVSGLGNGTTNTTDAAATRNAFLNGAVPVGMNTRFDVVPNSQINATDAAFIRDISFNGGLGVVCP
jgi:hypothetical protein